MKTPDWIVQLFRKVDAMDADGFVDHLTDDVRFRFGNGPEAKGREKVREVVSGFFKSIKALRHDLLETWIHSDVVICQGEVTYTRLDGSQITLPFIDLYRMKGDRIDQYLVYIDITPLYSPNSQQGSQ